MMTEGIVFLNSQLISCESGLTQRESDGEETTPTLTGHRRLLSIVDVYGKRIIN